MQVNIDNDTAEEITKAFLKQMIQGLVERKEMDFCVDDKDQLEYTVDGIIKVLNYILPPTEFKSFLKKNKIRKLYDIYVAE